VYAILTKRRQLRISVFLPKSWQLILSDRNQMRSTTFLTLVHARLKLWFPRRKNYWYLIYQFRRVGFVLIWYLLKNHIQTWRVSALFYVFSDGWAGVSAFLRSNLSSKEQGQLLRGWTHKRARSSTLIISPKKEPHFFISINISLLNNVNCK